MKLSKLQFNKLLQENRLVLSLIGMSNVGKTRCSQKLNGVGFQHFNCDDLIETRLALPLKKLGYTGTEGLSKWMGQPYEKRYPANQKKYLSLEKEVLRNIFLKIKDGKLENKIIDTTGSIVHVKGNMCAKLKKYSLVVYIKATAKIQEEMFARYIKEPKPVVFGKLFRKKERETPMQTLKKCYKKLLNLRSKLYEKYADVVIDCQKIKTDIDAKQLIALIKRSL